MQNTVGDFWRMIVQHKLSVIVMLTKINELGKVKGYQFYKHYFQCCILCECRRSVSSTGLI